MTTDIMILLGPGSKWNDEELRYSLRSIEKHAINLGDVWVIGQPRIELKNTRILNWSNNGNTKPQKTTNRILRFCTHKDAPRDWVMWNDDFYLTKEFDTNNCPIYYYGTLREYYIEAVSRGKDNLYTRLLNRSDGLLSGVHGCTISNFELHFPMPWDSVEYLNCPGLYEYRKGIGVLPRAVWGQHAITLDKYRVEEKEDLKLEGEEMKNREALVSSVIRAGMFSVGDSFLTEGGKSLLFDLYPDKSQFEV